MKSSTTKALLLIVAVILLFTLACGSTDVGTILNEVVSEVTAVSDDTTTNGSDSAWYLDEFDTSLDNWSEMYITSATDTEYEDGTDVTLKGGGLWFDINLADTYIYMFNDLYNYEDVSVAAEVASTGQDPSYISLMCRYDPDLGWYEFNIATSGEVIIYRYAIDGGEFTTLTDGTSDAINQGNATNQLLATCKGNELSLTINGQFWQTITDDTYSNGEVGVSAGSLSAIPVQVIFNWVEVTQP